MACGRGMLSSILKKKKQHNLCLDHERNFLENGSMLLEELITFSNGRYNIPIRRFSVEELSRATNGFCSDQIVTRADEIPIYKGSFEERLIFIKKNDDSIYKRDVEKSAAIRDIVVTALMSCHKNVLKLIGCCLDSEIPASVYECTGSIESLANRLYQREGDMVEEMNGGGSLLLLLTWKSRLKIANDIAYAVVYMHTAFPTPIINMDLKPSNIMIDQFGVAKLIEFSLAISLPPGETQVEAAVRGTYGYVEPEYIRTGFLNEKCDVYSFGIILLTLLTGKKAINPCREENLTFLTQYVKKYVDKDQVNEVVDPGILKERGGIAQEQQLQAVLALALRCIQENREERPEMIEVAKELRRIIKSVCPSLPQP